MDIVKSELPEPQRRALDELTALLAAAALDRQPA